MFATDDLLVGVDVHRQTNVVQVMNGAGDILTKPQRLTNNRPGTAALSQQLAELAQTGDYDRIHIAAEATNNYLTDFLL